MNKIGSSWAPVQIVVKTTQGLVMMTAHAMTMEHVGTLLNAYIGGLESPTEGFGFVVELTSNARR